MPQVSIDVVQGDPGLQRELVARLMAAGITVARSSVTVDTAADCRATDEVVRAFVASTPGPYGLVFDGPAARSEIPDPHLPICLATLPGTVEFCAGLDMTDAGVAGPPPAVLQDVGDDDGDCYVIGVRADASPGAWSLVFMAGDAEEDDGLGTYCLVVDPGQRTWYGGVRSWAVDGLTLRLALEPEAAAALGLPVAPVFALQMPSDQTDLLRQGLRRVLG
jgi:hypothetical protein